MNKRLAIVCIVLLCIGLSACQQWLGKPDGPMETTGLVTDITEDLHHRMKAGVMDLTKEPLVVSVVRFDPTEGQMDIPNAYLNVTWELGSFWVKSGDNGLVVTHWNTDAIYGHVKVTASTDGQGTRRYFPQHPQHPLRIDRF